MRPRAGGVVVLLAVVWSLAHSGYTVRTVTLPDTLVGVTAPSLLVNGPDNKVYVAGRGGPKVIVLDGATGDPRVSITVEGGTASAVLNPEANKLYVFRDDGRVMVLEAQGDSILCSINTGGRGFRSAGYAAGQNKVYAASRGEGYVYILRGDDDTSCISLAMPANPRACAYSPLERQIYYALDGLDSVAVLDADADSILSCISVPYLYQPTDICYNEVSNTVYVGDSNGRVFVIDCAGDSLLTVVQLNTTYLHLLSVPTLGRTYAFAYDDSGVAVLDSRTHTLRSWIPTPSLPVSYAHDEPGNRIYVLSEGHTFDLSAVSVIDCTADTLLRRFGAGFRGQAVCVGDSGRRLYIASPTKDEVWMFDTRTDSLLSRLPTAFAPRCVAYSLRLGRALWASSSCDRYAILDVRSDSVLALLPARMGTYSACLAPDLDKVYLSNAWFGYLSDSFVTAVDLAQCRETKQIRLGYMPMQQSYYESTSTLYVASGNSRVYAIDAVRDSVLRWGFTTVQPNAFGCNPATGRLYVASQGDQGLVVLDGTTFNVVAALKKGCRRGAVGFAPDVNKVYFGYAESVVVIDGSADTVLAELPSPGDFLTFCYNPYLRYMYSLDGWTGRLTTIDALTNSIVGRLATGSPLTTSCMAVDGTGQLLYMTDAPRNRLLVISGDGLQIVEDVDVGDYPVAVMAASPGTVVVGNNHSSSLSVVTLPSGLASGEPQPSRSAVPTLVRTSEQLTRGIDDVEMYDVAGRCVADAAARGGLKAGVYFWRATKGGATGGKVVVAR